jgi:hypothetical protein
MGINTENGFTEYRHIHTGMAKHPAVTLKLDVDQKNNVIKCAFAICSPEDNFARHMGRAISDRRMVDGEYVTFDYDREKSLNDNVIDYLGDLMAERIQPPENMRIMELARAYYYIDYILAVVEMRGQYDTMDDVMHDEEPRIITIDQHIIGA